MNDAVENFALADWLRWLEAHHPQQIELGLDRIGVVARRLALQPKAKIISVGGTNGKGSCVALLEAMLLAQGYRVGAYTSPHLLDYNERLRIDGKPVDDAQLCAAFRAVFAALGEVSLTYFEFGTLAALWLFQREPLDVWVLEVGLGGRLDAVNLIDADVSVLTTIDLDHQDWLGNDRESIGREKAGIFRQGRAAICVDPQPPQSVIDSALQLDAKLMRIGQGLEFGGEEGGTWFWRAALPGTPAYGGLPLPHLPLPSAAAAIAALHALPIKIDEPAIRAGLTQARLPGRFQQIEYGDVEIVLDVAHNPQAARYLAQRLREEPIKRTLAVFELMQDKDAAAIVSALHAQIDAWFVGELPDNPRAARAATVADILQAQQIQAVATYTSVDAAFAAALANAGQGDRIVVFGSFFTVAAVLQRLTA